MVQAKKSLRKARPIIAEYLEKVSKNIFDKHKKAITDRTRGQQGLYALYNMDKLYYVGLASNLRNRINTHLGDRHKSKWTHFSLYIIRHADHVKELESLLLRIAHPAGNKQKGKLRRSANILPDLKKLTKAAALQEWEELFEKQREKKRYEIAKEKTTSKTIIKTNFPLKGLFPGGKVIYATYQGKKYKAWVKDNGRIKYDSRIFDSPSAAGSAVKNGKAVDGWYFWKYKNSKSELVCIDGLRKKK